MPTIYQAPTASRNAILSIVLGCLFTFFVFLLVPITQFIADVTKQAETYDVRQASLPPPEEFEFEEEEIIEEEEEEEPPELEEEPPQLTLEQLDLALNPGMGGDLTGDFAMPGFSANQDDLNMDDIFDLGDLDQMPRAVKKVRPKYPKKYLKRNIEGEVRLIFIVDENGKVRDIKVHSATHPEFGEAAVEAIAQWEFEPGVKNGRSVKTRVRIPLPFRIK